LAANVNIFFPGKKNYTITTTTKHIFIYEYIVERKKKGKNQTRVLLNMTRNPSIVVHGTRETLTSKFDLDNIDMNDDDVNIY
jgi:hypothetical protein